MNIGTRQVVALVMLCHFIAAFAALGMPPFFATILRRSLHDDMSWLAGAFYVTPTLLAAVSAPWWGLLADRFGKKSLLVRAQLGLAASFVLTSYCTDSVAFLMSLALQGVLGGTFAASNAYLATVASGTALTRSLTCMQWSARAALVAAPVCLGLWMNFESPILLYRWLALLPATAALLIATLPVGSATHAVTRVPLRIPAAIAPVTPRQIYALEIVFTFATVVTLPYFISDVEYRLSGTTAATAGLLFSLPHVVYLIASPILSRWLGLTPSLATVGTAFTVLALSLIAQASSITLPTLICYRLLMGAGMTAGYICLHALVASVVNPANAGRTFGWIESSCKWGAVAGGLAAGAAISAGGPKLPYLIGAAMLTAAAGYLVLVARPRASAL